METSLIGKAVVFGSKECRFEPCVSKFIRIRYTQLTSLVKLSNQSKKRSTNLTHNFRLKRLIKVLNNIGLISVLIDNSRNFSFSANSYKAMPFFNNIKLVSSETKAYYITLQSLRKLSNTLRSTKLIMETNKGIMTHTTALRLNVGGKVLAIVSL